MLAGFIRAHPGPFAVSVAGSVVFAVATVMSTVVLGWLTDDVVLPEFQGTDPARGTGTVLLAVLGLAVLRSGAVVIRRYFAAMAMFLNKSDLQIELGDHYLAMPAEQLRVSPKGRLLAHVDSDADTAVDALSPLPFTIGVITLLVVSVASLAVLDWALTLVALALMPLIAALNQLNASVAERPALGVREAVGRVASVASESFDGAMVVKTLGREEAELDRFSVEAAGLRDEAAGLGRIRAIFGAALDLVPNVGIVALVAIGANRVAAGHITTGQLVQAVALFSFLVFPLQVIGYFFGDMPPAVVAHERISRVLAGRTARRVGRAKLPSRPLSVDVDAVSVAYGDRYAVREATLSVSAGEVLALVGSTGSGKSTLLAAVLDMVSLESGEVCINNTPVTDLAESDFASRVAMAWQEAFLLDASVADNIAFGGDYDRTEIEHAARLASFHEVASNLSQGYETSVGERGLRLSGGQAQRLALARAIIRRPGLLLLDDATSAIDPVVEERILNQLRAMDTTMVVVAHRRSTLLLADRVALIDEGRIVAVGTHRELESEPLYAALLEAYTREPT